MSSHRYDPDLFSIHFCERGFEITPTPLCPCDMRSTKRCTFELTGTRAGQQCGAPLCARCAYPREQGLAPGVCAAHAPKEETWDPTKVPRRTS